MVEIEVEAIGARGDGVARPPGGAGPVYVPLALPGDRLRVRLEARRGDGWAAREVEALARAPRANPACGHFGDCGGCALQHLPTPAYLEWKRRRVVDALARRGLAGAVEVVAPPRAAPPGSRRRARLRFDGRSRQSGGGGGVRLGFRARASHRTVDVRACAVLLPSILALLPPLRRALSGLEFARDGGEALVTATDGGLDVLLTAPREPGLADRERLAAFAAALDLARLAWRREAGTAAEPIAARRAATVGFGGVAVEPPPGAFLQATAFGEAALREEVLGAVGAGMRLADLFAGCGALGLPAAAARGVALEAFEAEAAMVDALARAARAAGLGQRVRAAARDLERDPLRPEELGRFDVVVLDPPRAGARAQSEALAASPVPVVLMASCDPATFARDARLLVDGGYVLERVVPIDQFLWSGQVELIATFRRKAPVDST
ncbi:MAG TPA: RsmD family RNA methyltransferase [Geminicoccaceae bacterium]|nr:RsmD family RNA methyltransferase [Geminicoccaceae bacterium]